MSVVLHLSKDAASVFGAAYVCALGLFLAITVIAENIGLRLLSGLLAFVVALVPLVALLWRELDAPEDR